MSIELELTHIEGKLEVGSLITVEIVIWPKWWQFWRQSETQRLTGVVARIETGSTQ